MRSTGHRFHAAIEIRPFKLALLPGTGTLAPQCPNACDRPLQAEAGFILKPQAQLFVRMQLRGGQNPFNQGFF